MHKLSYKTLFIIFFFLLIGVVVLSRFISPNNKIKAAWWNDNWNYRKSITIENPEKNQSNVYIILSLDTSNSSRFQDDCGDIRFTDQSKNILDYYIVSGCGSKNTSIHVNIPNLIIGSNNFHVYYGNSSIKNGFSQKDFSTPATLSTSSIDDEEKLTLKKIKIPSNHSKEVSEKYIISGNTFIRQAKKNPKNKIEVEVGDINRPDSFVPKVKLKKWDDEVNFSVKLIDNETDNPSVSTDKEKIKWTKNKKEINFYELSPSTDFPEGGYEFEITLKEKPATNKVEFNLETKGLEFIFQPELTTKEIADGASRPENVINSYAVYYKNHPQNVVGGKEYKTGKAFHIYRPKIQDANGNWIWGILNIDENNGLLTVTIPQEFLNNATYPITHAAGLTIGYTTIGSSELSTVANRMSGSEYLLQTGTIESINVYTRAESGGNFKSLLVKSSDKTIIPNGTTNAVATPITDTWVTFPFSTPSSVTNQKYYLETIGDQWFHTKYDYGSNGLYDTTNSYTTPTNPTDGTVWDWYKQSIYAVYTPNLSQSAFRWRNDDGPENTNILEFATKVDYTTAANPYNFTVGDVNMDGKPDLAVVNYGSGSTFVSVFINNGNGTFAAKVDYATGLDPISVAIGDVNMDGKPDLVVANEGSNSVSVFINKYGIGSSTFAARANYTTGTYPGSVAISDVNIDGKPDLAVSNWGSNSVSVLINNGNGTFATKVDYTTGTNPYFVAIGDLNIDGKPDLAVANSNSGTVSVFINNGNGTFATKVDYTTGTDPYFVAIGDLNMDGKPDMAVANGNSGTVSVFINNGNGTFAAKVDYATGTYPSSVAIGDVNLDGKPDLAVTNENTTYVSVFINKYGIGSSTFATKVDYTTGTDPIVVVISDLNMDGKPDLAVANYSSSSISILINETQKSLDIGTFATKVDYTTLSMPRSVAIGDLNMDSKPDLAVTNYGQNTVSVFINNGNGTFAAKVDYTTASSPRSVAISDLNMDGKPDLAVANFSSDSVSVFINNGNGTFAARINYTTGMTPTSVAIGDVNLDGKPDLAVTNSSSASVSIFINKYGIGSSTFDAKVDYNTDNSPQSVSIRDINIDGKPDLAVANYGSNSVSVFINNGSGNFTSRINYTTGTNSYSVAIGDINLDGKPDLAVAKSGSTSVSVFINKYGIGASTFDTKVDYNTGSSSYSVAIGDVNLDGKPDLAVTNYNSTSVSVFINNGNGTFAAKVDYATGLDPISVAIGDVNMDGKPDLAVTNYNSTSVSVFINNNTIISGASWLAAENTPITNVSRNSNIRLRFSLKNAGVGSTFNFKLQVAPKGGVSNCNTVASSSFSDVPTTAGSSVAVMTTSSNFVNQSLTTNQLTNPGGTFTSGKMVEYSSNQASSVSILSNYFTEAEYNFQLTANAAPNTSYCFRTINNLYSSFSVGTTYSSGVGASNPRSIASADFNNDGWPDLATANQLSNNISVYLNNYGTFNVGVTYFPGIGSSGSFFITSDDLNGDGYDDLISANYNNNSISVILNDGDGTFGTGVTYPTGGWTTNLSTSSITTADLNSDGRPDVISTNSSGHNISVFLNYYGIGSSTLGLKTDYPVTGAAIGWPKGVVAVDLNGDGRPDLATANESSHNMTVFLNYFGVGSSTLGLGTTFSGIGLTGPIDIISADFNRDGRPDLATLFMEVPYRILINNNYYGIGSSTLGVGVTYIAGNQPYAIVSADFNDDGWPDLATAENGFPYFITVFTNDGTGAFGIGTTAVYSTISDMPRGITSADFDGDGRQDLATANWISKGTITVFKNIASLIDNYSQVAELTTDNTVNSLLLKGLKLKGLIFK